MTKAGDRLIAGANEALSIAKGEQSAARITVKGHSYVPEAEIKALRSLLVSWNEARMALVNAAVGTSTREMWNALAEAEDNLRKAAAGIVEVKRD